MKNTSKKRTAKRRISPQEFDDKFDQEENITKYLDFKNATVVKKKS